MSCLPRTGLLVVEGTRPCDVGAGISGSHTGRRTNNPSTGGLCEGCDGIGTSRTPCRASAMPPHLGRVLLNRVLAGLPAAMYHFVHSQGHLPCPADMQIPTGHAHPACVMQRVHSPTDCWRSAERILMMIHLLFGYPGTPLLVCHERLR